LIETIELWAARAAGNSRSTFGFEKVANLPDRGKMEPLAVRPRSSLFLKSPAESDEHLSFKVVQVVSADCFPRRNKDRVATTHFKHSAVDGDVMLAAMLVAPSHHRNRKCGQKVGVARQKAESSRFVLGPEMRYIVGFNDNRERRGDGKSHEAPLVA
jgi:hypothetical protein